MDDRKLGIMSRSGTLARLTSASMSLWRTRIVQFELEDGVCPENMGLCLCRFLATRSSVRSRKWSLRSNEQQQRKPRHNLGRCLTTASLSSYFLKGAPGKPRVMRVDIHRHRLAEVR